MRRCLATLIVAVLPWLIAPGYIQPDTKADLTLAPWAWLGRAWWAWNDHAGLGELQNQAYGYLFPLGPFLGLTTEVMPAWAAQRIWWSLLLVVAFLGAERLIRRLGVSNDAVALVAAASYALSSRVLTVLPEISIEAWPAAVAPWLVVVAHRMLGGSRRELAHGAALTALLVAALGGVNATASAIVCVLPLTYLLTSPRGFGRGAAVVAWSLGAVAGAFWWLAPLFVLGRFSYPFLDNIENASMTNAVTSVPNVLRGASHWVAYIVDSESHPVWQAGWMQAQAPVAIVTTCLVAGLAMVGMTRLRGHVARFALVSFTLGFLALTLGYAGVGGSPLAPSVQSFLDSVGAPLRNVHKADPLVRLPLALGLAVLAERWLQCRVGRVRTTGLAVASVVLLATPVAWWSGRGGDAWAYADVPQAWTQLARTVDHDASERGGSTLLLPASRTAHFTWGRPNDEPLSALASSPVVFRNAAPLGHVGAWQMLDRLDLMAASGSEQPGLAAAYGRMGVARVVVRRQLHSSTSAEPFTSVENTLALSPGFTLESESAEASLWRIDEFTDGASLVPEALLRTPAAPDALPALIAAGVLPVGAGVQTQVAQGADFITDASKLTQYNNGLPTQDAYGATAQGTSPMRSTRQARHGITVTASSSAASPFARGHTGAANSQLSAVDGDPATFWRSAREKSSWLRLTWPDRQPAETLTISLTAGRGLPLPRGVELVVGDGPRRTVVSADVAGAQVSAAIGVHDRVTVRFPPLATDASRAISEIDLNGEPIGVETLVPGTIQPERSAVVLTRDLRDRVSPVRAGEDGAHLSWRITTASAATMRRTTTWVRSDGSLRTHDDLVELPAGSSMVDARDGDSERLRSVVLRPLAPAAASSSAGTLSRWQRQHPGSYTADIRTSATGILALAQGANAGWRAELGGVELSPVTVDGWRQGFRVPAGTKGTVDITFAPNRMHQAGLALGGFLVLVAAFVALFARGPARVREVPAEVSRPRPIWLPAIGTVLLTTVVGGWLGLAAGMGALLVPRRWLPAALLGAVTAAGVSLAAFGVVQHGSLGATAGQVGGLGGVALMWWAAGLGQLRDGAPNAEPVVQPTTSMPPPTPR